MGEKALITGITGQDGSYLAEFLLSKGYEVHGLIRRSSSFNTSRIDHLFKDPHEKEAKMFLHFGDLANAETLTNIIYNIKPDEIYQIAAQSHVRVSFDMPEYTGDITGLGTTRVLDAVRRSGVKLRYYQASSSEMFGNAPPPQNEATPFQPRSPYAAAKVYGYWIAATYRDAYNIHATNGILFNHESPRRGETFVTRKITRAIARILANKQEKLYLGNLDSRRDWGFAPEYVEMMWKMLQLDNPGDYVVGTGETHSVREFVDEAFSYVGLNPKKYVTIDPYYYRPAEVDVLQADASKARDTFTWEPKVTFKDLVKVMVDFDVVLESLDPVGEGFRIMEHCFPHITAKDPVYKLYQQKRQINNSGK